MDQEKVQSAIEGIADIYAVAFKRESAGQEIPAVQIAIKDDEANKFLFQNTEYVERLQDAFKTRGLSFGVALDLKSIHIMSLDYFNDLVQRGKEYKSAD